MKKVQLSVLALIAGTNLLMAGGDIMPITPYEIEDVQEAEVISITPTPEPIPVVAAPPVPVVIPVVPIANVSPIYVGLGLVAARYDSNCNSTCVNDGVDKTGGILVRAGYDFNKYLVEV